MAQLQKYLYQFNCMTTPCELQIFSDTKKSADNLANKIEKNTRRLEAKYNFFSENSFLTLINNRKKPEVALDLETLSVLKKIQILSKNTNGHFDITMGTLKPCLKMTTSIEIEACRAKLKPFTGVDSWQLSADGIHFSNPYVKLDFGGVIKEYAVDQAAHFAKEADLSTLINFGGDIYVNGLKPDGSPFGVAIKNPKNPSENAAVVQLTNQGLTTSAHYERSTNVDGKNYSHIIGEQTVQSKNILSATVITDSVMASGVYSTSLMLDPTLDIISKIGVVLIDKQLRLHQNIFEG